MLVHLRNGLGLAAGLVVAAATIVALCLVALGQSQAYAHSSLPVSPQGATATATTTCGSQPIWVLGPTEPPGAVLINGVTASDGNFYALGGQDNGSTPTPTPLVEKFNSTTNTWSRVAPLPVAAGQIGVGAPVAGKVYGAGGFIGMAGTTFLVTNTLQIYDIASDSWSFGPPVPVSPGIEAPATASYNGKLYLFGGDDGGTGIYNTTYVLDTATNTWTTGAPMPANRTNDVATIVGGMIYVYGGVDSTFTSQDSLYAYNPSTNTWATLAPSGHPENGFSPGIAPFGTGRFVVDGGQSFGTGAQPTDLTLFYDIASNSWTEGPRLNAPRSMFAEDRLPDGRVIAYAGATTNGTVVATTEFLNPPAPCTATPTATNAVTSTPTATATSPSTSTSTPGVGSPTVTSTPCTINFSDVQPSDYFYNDVRCVYCLGAVSGYSDGTFRPFNNTTRGQMTKIITIALAIPIATPTGTPTFSDVPPGSPFYDYVETLAALNIVSGYADGTFRPNTFITRGQLSKIDAVAANHVFGWELLNPPTQTFSDVPPGSPFYEYIETVHCHNVVSGYSDGTFRPGNNAIRAQIAKIVCATSQNPPDQCASTPTAVAAH